jgi:hypothetical protein
MGAGLKLKSWGFLLVDHILDNRGGGILPDTNPNLHCENVSIRMPPPVVIYLDQYSFMSSSFNFAELNASLFSTSTLASASEISAIWLVRSFVKVLMILQPPGCNDLAACLAQALILLCKYMEYQDILHVGLFHVYMETGNILYY